MPEHTQHAGTIVEEFTRQSAAFNVSPIMNSAETLQRLIDLLPADAGQRWLEVACGPGLISRRLAPRAGTVVGVDLTLAMLDVARVEARKAALANAIFTAGDGTRLPFADGTFDGAVTRFSLHHIPAPGRCVAEMARVVMPGGWVAIADHITSDDQEAAAWHQEVERLRDPSHWACLTPAQLRRHGERAGLLLRREEIVPITLDYEEWLTRGSGGPAARPIVAELLRSRPEGCDALQVTTSADGVATMHLRYWLSLWERG